ncbi:MAG: hypothetical protein AB1726_11305 [Planctomycetota bacterium]
MQTRPARVEAVPALRTAPPRRPGDPPVPGGAAEGRVPRRSASPPGAAEVPATEFELRPAELEAGAAEVRARLLRHGVSTAFADRVVRAVLESEARGAYAIDAAALAIGRLVPLAPSPKRSGAPHLIAFVGPTGAGKTSTLAKLGRRLAGAGRRVLYATLDPVGASALEADVDRTEVPLVALRGNDDLRRALRRSSAVDVVLVDTPGLSPRGEDELDRLAQELPRLGRDRPSDVYLVLPAPASRSALGIALLAYARMRPTAAVVTKLDESSEPATAIEEAVHMRLPLAFLCDGQDVRAHLARPSPDRLADLFLRGRLA